MVIKQYGVDYESGTWNLEWRENSSNCRETENLTNQMERLVADGSLVDHEVFLITDNSSCEGAHYNGLSLTRQLSEIMFRVHKAEQDVHPTHHPHLGEADEGIRGGRPL